MKWTIFNWDLYKLKSYVTNKYDQLFQKTNIVNNFE